MAKYVSLDRLSHFLLKVNALIPTKTSDINNDSGFITSIVNNLSNYYLKTETYTQTEVNSLIGALQTIQIQLVDVLPTTGQSNIIYLVPNGGTGTNAKDEYVWVAATSSFEKIGTTEIDLSAYWAKADLAECTNAEIDTLFE